MIYLRFRLSYIFDVNEITVKKEAIENFALSGDLTTETRK